MPVKHVIIGCGDIGQRLALSLFEQGVSSSCIIGTNRTGEIKGELQSKALDLDHAIAGLGYCHNAKIFYLIPPQQSDQLDLRSRRLLDAMERGSILPKKVVLLSTTGVYGDLAGEWVSEASPCAPATDRAKRRLDAEQQWLSWGEKLEVPVVVLRVPGIYARSRIPRKRLEAGTPVVRAEQCGFTNRIHADDLVQVLDAAMKLGKAGEVFNASDGCPGKVSEYLQAAARELGLPPLAEISLQQAETQLSEGMMSYLRESRRIDNQKMLTQLKVELRYPNFELGLKFG